MSTLRSLVGGVADIPLRPLLVTAGAAAAAVGIYWRFKRRDGEKTAAPEGTEIYFSF